MWISDKEQILLCKFCAVFGMGQSCKINWHSHLSADTRQFASAQFESHPLKLLSHKFWVNWECIYLLMKCSNVLFVFDRVSLCRSRWSQAGPPVSAWVLGLKQHQAGKNIPWVHFSGKPNRKVLFLSPILVLAIGKFYLNKNHKDKDILFSKTEIKSKMLSIFTWDLLRCLTIPGASNPR